MKERLVDVLEYVVDGIAEVGGIEFLIKCATLVDIKHASKIVLKRTVDEVGEACGREPFGGQLDKALHDGVGFAPKCGWGAGGEGGIGSDDVVVYLDAEAGCEFGLYLP